MQVRFDQDRCQGHAQCAANGPDMYPLDEVGYCALPEMTAMPADLEKQARAGADACPEQALTIID